ncbi:MAG: methylated-DNA--[protein]-cysteine S-methyltransferase [Methylomonas sp.]
MKQPIVYCLFETPLGWCGIAWRESGDSGAPPPVVLFQLPEATQETTERKIIQDCAGRRSEPPPEIAGIIRKVCKHLSGDPQDFRDIVLDLEGIGSFAQQVYAAARAIPAGQTRTYGEIARALNCRAAARAVGQALGRNPAALIVPCHRVLAAGGKPGGFSAHGGRTTKARMLAMEGVSVGLPATIKSKRDLRRAADHLKAADPKLAVYMARPLEFKLDPEHSPYVSLFTAVVHQQLTPKAASTILGRVKALYPGAAIPAPGDLLNTPDQSLRDAGLSRAKTASLKDLAAKTLAGAVPSAREIVALGDEEIIRRLTSIYGVGRWTVEMLLIFSLGRADVFPADDYALRKGIAELYGMAEIPTPKKLGEFGDMWRPYRTVAALYLWNFLDN